MLTSLRQRSSRRVLLASCLTAAALAALPAATAHAAAATAVTVRVEGLAETKLPPTQVTLTGAPVVKDGNSEHACSGGSALAALDLVTTGNWSGPWNSKFQQYEIYGIQGELHQFEEGAAANYFWSFWLDDKEAEVGACEAQLKPGDRVLFFPSCFGKECPVPTPLPLELEAPAGASVGEPVTITVRRYTSAGVASEVAGASVVGGGSGAITDGAGHATLTFSHAGETLVQTNAPSSIRSEAFVCVHAGNDGTCGTTAPSTTPGVTNTGPAKPTAPVADAATVAGVRQGAIYSRRHAPRLLGGVIHVSTGGGLRDVRISLVRRMGKRCYVFSGVREAFVRARCGTTRFFSVGGAESFTYLLPSRLPRGRYTYDVQAVEASGQITKLAPGVSEVVFRVA